ncbi:MAG: hypothetical protein LAN62_09690 [Acidobacteriia bacterium]|nr:hypothetical protein [Terriglobia bacterium]
MGIDLARFIFWTATKTLALVILGLMTAKAVRGLRDSGASGTPDRLPYIKGALYAAILALVILGAQNVGTDIAAENYARASQRNLANSQLPKAYENARRAVELRPGERRYWHTLWNAKFARRQYASLLADRPTLFALGGGKLEEEDAYTCAAAYYFLAQYDQVIPLTENMIRENRAYAAPYVLQGYTYLAQKKFAEAERSFLEVLQTIPTLEVAVAGLAHAHYLRGDRAGAQAVLDETSRFSFSPEARRRFQDLKALYAQ